jgi:drug/metabolite transporter (DMT)-like permease
LNKLTRYFVVGAILIVLGVILVAAGTAGLPPPVKGSLYILGLISVIFGLVLVVGALWIDLSQLNRERAKQQALVSP